jgi:hypothetical protein
MGDLPVRDIGTAEVMRVLEPIWHEKPETGSRVRGQIETILDYAKARHWRTGDNCARERACREPAAHTSLAKADHSSCRDTVAGVAVFLG